MALNLCNCPVSVESVCQSGALVLPQETHRPVLAAFPFPSSFWCAPWLRVADHLWLLRQRSDRRRVSFSFFPLAMRTPYRSLFCSFAGLCAFLSLSVGWSLIAWRSVTVVTSLLSPPLALCW